MATSSSGSSTRVCTSVCLTMPDALLAISRQQHDRIEGDLEQRDARTQAEDAAGHEEAGSDESLRASEPVDRGADQRRQHRKRRHRDQEVEQHLLARGVRADVEEQRPGQADRHERVAGCREPLRGRERHHRSPADQECDGAGGAADARSGTIGFGPLVLATGRPSTSILLHAARRTPMGWVDSARLCESFPMRAIDDIEGWAS